MNKDKCKDCKHYQILNPHHIVNGEPYKSCDIGNEPDSCREEEEE